MMGNNWGEDGLRKWSFDVSIITAVALVVGLSLISPTIGTVLALFLKPPAPPQPSWPPLRDCAFLAHLFLSLSLFDLFDLFISLCL